MPSANEINGWHSIEDRDPPAGTLVLCQGQHGGLFLGVHVGLEYFAVPNARTGRRAVAWHDLPSEPYLPKEKKL